MTQTHTVQIEVGRAEAHMIQCVIPGVRCPIFEKVDAAIRADTNRTDWTFGGTFPIIFTGEEATTVRNAAADRADKTTGTAPGCWREPPEIMEKLRILRSIERKINLAF